MRQIATAMAAIALTSGVAVAASDALVGTWMTEERDSKIRVTPCGGGYCATIVWTKDGGTDEHNPNETLRRRSIVGVQLTKNMQANREGGWSGSIYNPEDGKTYSGSMSLKGANALEVSGCVLGGLVCGHDTWTRQSEDSASAAPGR